MVDFIQEIYNSADIIEKLREFISLSEQGLPRDARTTYNAATCALETLLEKISATNLPLAAKLQNIAVKIKDSFDDICVAKGLVRGDLIPAMYLYMNDYTGIEVSEGKYLLKSSSTGYLTIRDNETNRFFHDIYDPMWESYEIVRSALVSDTNNFLVFGCGLGYTAYQLWHQSEGAVHVFLYEDDPVILKYAYDYGVLSLIPESCITIIHDTDKESLADRFVNDIRDKQAGENYILAPWKAVNYKENSTHEINRIATNHRLFTEMVRRSSTNLFKNLQLKHILFEDIIDKYIYDEWVIISAGPSFDNSLDFIKSSRGKRGLIAVNTVIRRLVKEGIRPDIIVAADQYIQMVDHIKGIEEHTEGVYLVADWLLNWKYASMYRGPICFVRTNAGTDLTNNPLGSEPIWDISGTVACLGIETAIRLNAKQIYLVGQDLAYPSGQRYAKDMPHKETNDIKQDILVPSVDGTMVNTCEAFVWFRKCIEYQIERNRNIEFINLSKHGALIAGSSSYNS